VTITPEIVQKIHAGGTKKKEKAIQWTVLAKTQMNTHLASNN